LILGNPGSVLPPRQGRSTRKRAVQRVTRSRLPTRAPAPAELVKVRERK
jgi:hypothetical protein